MTFDMKKDACSNFFNKLSTLLSDTYEVLESCNQDFSRYLIPHGTSDQVTYHGKPLKSFRISDHWNWFSNLRKCPDPNYVQCRSLDMPWCRKREKGDPMATKPRFGIQVCIQLEDGCYHHVYGDKFNRKTKTWKWIETRPEDVIRAYFG